MSLWGQRVTFEVSSASPDDTPVWVDLSRYVRHESGLEITAGRQNNLDSSEPSTLRFVLNNADGRFTFGNTASPYASWWAPGRKCRLRETYGSTVTDLFTGYLQVPEEALPDASSNSQYVSVSAIDRLGRLGAYPTFLSTLGAHILYNGGSSLLACWPFTDPTAAQVDVSPAAAGVLPVSPLNHLGGSPTEEPFQPQSGPPVLADDLTPGLFAPALSGSLVALAAQAKKTDLSVTIDSDTITVAWWMRFTDTHTDDVFPLDIRYINSAGAVMQIVRVAGQWKVSAVGPGSTVTFNIDTPPTQKWSLCALRMTLPSGLIEFWIDGKTAQTGTMSATPPTSATFEQLSMGDNFAGSFAYVQIYTGSTYTRAVHLAQFQLAQTALERQTTGDRIRTIAAYAGIPLAEYNDTIDKGTAVMQRASLAGKTPLQAMREAERTEQGLLYVDGSGRLVFKDRKTLYNI